MKMNINMDILSSIFPIHRDDLYFITAYLIVCAGLYFMFETAEYCFNCVYNVFAGVRYHPYIWIGKWRKLPFSINKRYKITNRFITYEVYHISVVDLNNKYATHFPSVGIYTDDIQAARGRLQRYYKLSVYESIILIRTVYPPYYPCIIHICKIHPGYIAPNLPGVKWFNRRELLRMDIFATEKKLLKNYAI
jgi:hypothetical protein